MPMADFLEASDSELIAHIRQQAETIYHPMSTCAIGRVVDERLRVKGIAGLRVCDASVFPESVSGHPVSLSLFHSVLFFLAPDPHIISSGCQVAAVVAIAEKFSDMLKSEAKA